MTDFELPAELINIEIWKMCMFSFSLKSVTISELLHVCVLQGNTTVYNVSKAATEKNYIDFVVSFETNFTSHLTSSPHARET